MVRSGWPGRSPAGGGIGLTAQPQFSIIGGTALPADTSPPRAPGTPDQPGGAGDQRTAGETGAGSGDSADGSLPGLPRLFFADQPEEPLPGQSYGQQPYGQPAGQPGIQPGGPPPAAGQPWDQPGGPPAAGQPWDQPGGPAMGGWSQPPGSQSPGGQSPGSEQPEQPTGAGYGAPPAGDPGRPPAGWGGSANQRPGSQWPTGQRPTGQRPVRQRPSRPPERELRQRAIAAFALGLLSLVALFGLGADLSRGVYLLVFSAVIGLAGCVIGITAVLKARRTGTFRPRGAIAGIVLGALAMVISVPILATYLAFPTPVSNYVKCLSQAQNSAQQHACMTKFYKSIHLGSSAFASSEKRAP